MVGSVSLIIPLASLMVESPPLLMTLLVGQSLLVVGFTGLLKSIWYSYILFMVFLGGILVIFAYVSSLVETQKMELNMKMLSLVVLGVLGILVLFKLGSSSVMLKDFDNNTGSEEFLMHGLISVWSGWVYAM
uniref:NADH dehydrogenase subunit 6 n=1 Tax=Oniscus asellus TaxID=96861 RepID=A0A1P8DKD4_ONIAS|nr:NADH dehydrogenase subunit 6 [Oniscus asellus]